MKLGSKLIAKERFISRGVKYRAVQVVQLLFEHFYAVDI
jgi:hypothetical protein